MNGHTFIKPSWPAPSRIKAYSTLRHGGVSPAPYKSFNLGTHVADKIENVIKNRQILTQMLQLPNEPVWIQQTHHTLVLPAADINREKEADATFADKPNQVCAILTADCLPILLCNRQGTVVAAIHAGWRGLAKGIISETLRAINLSSDDILVWLGPAISAACYEVGDEVRKVFLDNNPEATTAFTPSSNGRWLSDLYALARLELKKHRIDAIYGGEYCTYSDDILFFSYRRDGANSGRMASLIWINDSSDAD